MNGEWIFLEIARWVLSLALVYVGYFLGLRSQKMQALREYITEIVKDEYPALFSEIKRNSRYLDSYLEKPDYHFPFPKLHHIFDRGLDKFIEKHHKDLHLMVNSFGRNILPRFNELNVGELKEKLFDASSKHLRESLPKEVASISDRVAVDLAKSINPHYIIPDLLTGKDEEVRNKIEKCIWERISQIYPRLSIERIKEQLKEINFDEISQSLIEKVKPETGSIVNIYKELKEQNDKEVKEKLLPLLQKYISKPI